MHLMMGVVTGTLMGTPVVVPVVARRLYGHWRARYVDEQGQRLLNDHNWTDPEMRLEQALRLLENERPTMIFAALICGVVWQVTLVVWLLIRLGDVVVRKLFGVTSQKSRLEVEVDRARVAAAQRALDEGVAATIAERDRKIAELERTELGLPTSHDDRM